MRLTPPDFAAGAEQAAVGFIHRKLPWGDIYFVTNTSNHPVETTATVRVSGMTAEWWNPFNGEATRADVHAAPDRTEVPLKLAPYESRVLVFSEQAGTLPAAVVTSAGADAITLDAGGTVSFPALHKTVQTQQARSWTDDEATRFYSGQAIYQQSVFVPELFLAAGARVLLDFGPGKPVQAETKGGPGMRALLESPVRESAVVYVNGQRAGYVWHPPYRLDATRFLHSGANQFRVVVANTAINELAGEAPKSHRLLNLRYGERFKPQDMNDLKPLPSGILGTVRLVRERVAQGRERQF